MAQLRRHFQGGFLTTKAAPEGAAEMYRVNARHDGVASPYRHSAAVPRSYDEHCPLSYAGMTQIRFKGTKAVALSQPMRAPLVEFTNKS